MDSSLTAKQLIEIARQIVISAEQANELEKERISAMLGVSVEKLKEIGYFDIAKSP